MFSTGYPYEDIQVAANWIENADLPDDQRIQVCVANAQRLLRLG